MLNFGIARIYFFNLPQSLGLKDSINPYMMIIFIVLKSLTKRIYCFQMNIFCYFKVTKRERERERNHWSSTQLTTLLFGFQVNIFKVNFNLQVRLVNLIDCDKFSVLKDSDFLSYR